MISNLGKDTSDSASCNWFNLQIRESLQFLKLKQPELNFKTAWNIPFWLLPQLSPAPCPTCLSRSSVASFCKAESLKPVMRQGHTWHTWHPAVIHQCISTGQDDSSSWRKCIGWYACNHQFRASQYRDALKTPSFCHVSKMGSPLTQLLRLGQAKGKAQSFSFSPEVIDKSTNRTRPNVPITSMLQICCVHVSVMQCCCRSVKSWCKKKLKRGRAVSCIVTKVSCQEAVDSVELALAVRPVVPQYLSSWKVFWNFQNVRMCRRQSYKRYTKMNRERESEEREEPMRNTTKVLLFSWIFLAFTKQWPSLRVRSTVGRESGILSYRQIFKISTAGCELRKEQSRQFSWDHEAPSFSRLGDGKCRGDCIIQILKGCSLPSRRDFWLLSAPTQSQTKWCRAIQKSQAIVLPLSFLPIEIRFEAITSTKSCLNCD